MYRGLLFFLLVIAGLIYFGVKTKKINRSLSTALFAAAGSLFLLMMAGFFGWIGG